MQENNFEKEVRRKLDGLQLTPSEPVWQKVEAAIKKKKERRRAVWMLPLLLLCGGLAWWLATPHNKTIAEQSSKEQVGEEQTFSKPHAGAVNGKTEQETDSPQQPMPPEGRQANAVDKAAAQKATNKRYTNRPHTDFENRVALRNINPEIIDENNDNPKGVNTNETISKVTTKPADVTVTKTTFIDRQPAFLLNIDKMPVMPDAKSKIVIDEEDRLKSSRPTVQTKKAAWQWNITSRAGASNVSEELFSLAENKSARAESRGNDVASPGNFASSSAAVQRSSSSTKGAQFSIGIGLKKAVFKRTFFVTGLQYGFYRNYATTEPYLPCDSIASSLYNIISAQNAYRNTRITNRYTNTFHLIELPIGVEHQLFKNIPLHLQYGVAISQLLSGKAVRYNSNTNLYYQDGSALRKTGISFYTALDYTVWKGKGLSLQAGPQVQYGLRDIFKETSAKSHLVSGGIALTMGF
jgi:hypothetical protein